MRTVHWHVPAQARATVPPAPTTPRTPEHTPEPFPVPKPFTILKTAQLHQPVDHELQLGLGTGHHHHRRSRARSDARAGHARAAQLLLHFKAFVRCGARYEYSRGRRRELLPRLLQAKHECPVSVYEL